MSRSPESPTNGWTAGPVICLIAGCLFGLMAFGVLAGAVVGGVLLVAAIVLIVVAVKRAGRKSGWTSFTP